MSIHSSFKKNKNEHRTVKKRWERLKALREKGKTVLSIFGLPKEKIIRYKLKKEPKEETKKTLVEIAQEPTKKEK